MDDKIPYDEMTIEMKTEYNRRLVDKIIAKIDTEPLPYCAQLRCMKCPCNISEEKDTGIICITQIKRIR